MPGQNELDIPFSLAAMRAEVDATIRKMGELKAAVQDALAQGNAQPGQVSAGIAAVRGAQSAQANLQSSVQGGGVGGPTSGSNLVAGAVMGAAANVALFNKMSGSLQAGDTLGLMAAAKFAGVSYTPGAAMSSSVGPMAMAQVASISASAFGAANAGMSSFAMAQARQSQMALSASQQAWVNTPYQMGPLPASAFVGGMGHGQITARDIVLGRAAMGLNAMQTVTGGLNAYAQSTASGENDPMAMAGLAGAATLGPVFGALGAATSPAAPGAGFMTGMLVGRELGSAGAQATLAPFMKTRAMALNLSSVSARMGVNPYDLIAAPMGARNGQFRNEMLGPSGMGLSRLAAEISMEGKSETEKILIRSGTYTGTDVISGVKMSQVYSSIASGMLAAGDNPAEAIGPSANLARRYGISAPSIAQSLSPVYAARNRTGRNMTDLLMSVGPEAYGAFTDAEGMPDLSGGQRSNYGAFQSLQHRGQIAALRATGSGAALQHNYLLQQWVLESLPGGRDSLAYAQAGAGYRDASSLAFDQGQIGRFSVPLVESQARIARAMVHPYRPGEVMGEMYGQTRLQFGEARRVRGEISARGRAGTLSDEDRLRYTTMAAGMETAGYQGIAQIAEGAADRLGVLYAGMNRSSHFDSMQQASVMLRGTPFRRWGAMGGRQARQQEEFYQGMGASGPVSREANLNPAMGGGRVEALLEQLIRAVERAGGRIGGVGGMTRGGGDLPPSGGRSSGGGTAPVN